MSNLSKRTSALPMKRESARRAINRISAELEAIVEASKASTDTKHLARMNVVATLNFLMSELYGGKK